MINRLAAPPTSTVVLVSPSHAWLGEWDGTESELADWCDMLTERTERCWYWLDLMDSPLEYLTSLPADRQAVDFVRPVIEREWGELDAVPAVAARPAHVHLDRALGVWEFSIPAKAKNWGNVGDAVDALKAHVPDHAREWVPLYHVWRVSTQYTGVLESMFGYAWEAAKDVESVVVEPDPAPAAHEDVEPEPHEDAPAPIGDTHCGYPVGHDTFDVGETTFAKSVTAVLCDACPERTHWLYWGKLYQDAQAFTCRSTRTRQRKAMLYGFVVAEKGAA